MNQTVSRTAEIRAVARHDLDRAEILLKDFLEALFDRSVRSLRINVDKYSLNSLNGFLELDGKPCFFKFHQEEGEEDMRGEYYRADILAKAALPVDQPILSSTIPGEQILIYRRRDDPRFSDVLRELDLSPNPQRIARAAAAEAELNDRLLDVAQATLHAITPEQSAAEPIHRLFHERLIDPVTGSYPSGRLASFYVDKVFDLPGLRTDWATFSRAKLRLNGLAYERTVGELFDAAYTRLAPARLADAGGITAHGDAHNANVWYERGAEADHLSLFDPAFAGSDVPSLLAEVKSTFHNIFAHPLWLYDSDEAAGRFQVSAGLSDGVLSIETDWQLGPVRERLLEAKSHHYWKPWLATLRDRNLLPEHWEEVVRLALFLCPTLVMNLRAGPEAGRHNPQSSATGWLIAVMAGSRPSIGEDPFTRFFDQIRP